MSTPTDYEKYGCPACVNGNAGDVPAPECPKCNPPKPAREALEIEISTEGARSLLEIGFDLGAAAAQEQCKACSLGLEYSEPVNPFRRVSTVIVEPDPDNEARLKSVRFTTQIERVEADAAANARAHERATACTCSFPVISTEHQNYCPRSKARAHCESCATLISGTCTRCGRKACL